MEKENVKLDFDKDLIIGTPVHVNKRRVKLPTIPKNLTSCKVEIIMNELFLACFCLKRYDGTRKLVLQGNDLFPRIGRCFEDRDVPDLCCFLSKNHDVTSIDLAYNKIQCDGFTSIIDNIVKHQNVLELNVQNNDIAECGVNYMYQKSEQLQLRSLRINGNKIGAKGAIKIASMLKENSFLRHLDVAEIDQNISSLLYFTTVVRNDQVEFNQTLKILDLSRPNPPHMHFFDSEHFAEAIGSMLRYNQSLVELHLQKCTFSCHDIEQMLFNMRYNKTLHLLDLNYNNIGDYGAELISNWLKERPALRGLLLSGNIIATGGARALSCGIPFSRLRLLDLSHNRIQDEGMVAILNTIKKSPPMYHFRIFGNAISTPTIKIIDRLLMAKIIMQENIDVMPYTLDGSLRFAYYPCDRYKQLYYNVPRYGYPQPLKCTFIEDPTKDQNFPKYYFKYIDPEVVVGEEDCIIQPLKKSMRKCECAVCERPECKVVQQIQAVRFENVENIDEADSEDLDEESICCICDTCDETAICNVTSNQEFVGTSAETSDLRLKQKIKLILDRADENLKEEILRWIPIDEPFYDVDEESLINQDIDSPHETQK